MADVQTEGCYCEQVADPQECRDAGHCKMAEQAFSTQAHPHIILVRLGEDHGEENGTLACITADGAVAVFGSEAHAEELMTRHPLRTRPYQVVKVEI